MDDRERYGEYEAELASLVQLLARLETRLEAGEPMTDERKLALKAWLLKEQQRAIKLIQMLTSGPS